MKSWVGSPEGSSDYRLNTFSIRNTGARLRLRQRAAVRLCVGLLTGRSTGKTEPESPLSAGARALPQTESLIRATSSFPPCLCASGGLHGLRPFLGVKYTPVDFTNIDVGIPVIDEADTKTREYQGDFKV